MKVLVFFKVTLGAVLSVELGAVDDADISCNPHWDLQWKEEKQSKSPHLSSNSDIFIGKKGLETSCQEQAMGL